MSDNVTGLFKRGQTYNGPNKTLSSSYGQSVGIEGTVRYFDDVDPSSGSPGVKSKRSDRVQTAMIVRNVSGITLLPKRIVKWASGYRGRRVDGYCNATAEEVAGVVDERLGSSGVRNYDLFWIQVKGPCLCKTGLAAAAATAVTEGQILYALTAATSQATTAGRPVGWGGTFTATQTTDGTAGKIVANAIGRAMSAKTSGNTNTDFLVDLQIMK